MQKLSTCFYIVATGLTLLAGPANSMTTAMVLSDNCVITQGYAPETGNLTNRPLARLTIKESATPSREQRFAGEVGILLARELIDFGLDKAKAYLERKAEPQTTSFSNTIPTTLMRLSSPETLEAGTTIHDVTLEPTIACVTFLANVRPITHNGAKTRKTSGAGNAEWREVWDKTGPDPITVNDRLQKAGFNWKNDSLALVFEGRWHFSDDGQAAHFVPLYIMVQNFEHPDKTGTAQANSTRQMALAIRVSRPTNGGTTEDVVMSQRIDIGKVSITKRDGPSINGVSAISGLGPKYVQAVIPTQGWGGLSLDLSESIKPLEKALKAKVKPEDIRGFDPVNVIIEATATKNPNAAIVFLAGFVTKEDVKTKLSNAIRDELGLNTDSEITAERVAKIDAQIAFLESSKEILNEITEDERNNIQIAQLAAIPGKILELKILKLQLNSDFSLGDILDTSGDDDS